MRFVVGKIHNGIRYKRAMQRCCSLLLGPDNKFCDQKIKFCSVHLNILSLLLRHIFLQNLLAKHFKHNQYYNHIQQS